MPIEDLSKLYQNKTDEELLQLATDREQLTPEAYSVLTGELTRRRIEVREPAPATESEPEKEADNRGLSLPTYPRRVGEFVEEVLSVYRGHFWVFIKLMAPAVVVGYMAVFLTQNEVREIARQGLLSHRTDFVGMRLVACAGYFVSWMAFSFSFGAICFSLDQIQAGFTPSIADSLAVVTNRLGAFLRLSLLLLLMIVAAGVVVAALIVIVVFAALSHGDVHLGRSAIWVVTLAAVSLVLLLMSRFGLAIPALVLDDLPVGQAMFRSDQLTKGKWAALAVLLAKSLIGSYVAGMAPFWLASLIPANAQLPPSFWWILRTASMVGVTVVEPMMFIGFALLYLRNTPTLPISSVVPRGQPV
jgi:hypothetical protein